MKRIRIKNKELIGLVIGAGAGWVYWLFKGCLSGSCTMFSKAQKSLMHFWVLGFLVWSSKEKNK